MRKIVKLVKRPREKNKPRAGLPVYDICVVYKSDRRKRVYEKLGLWSVKGVQLRINSFRLVYWLSKKAALSGNAFRVLETNLVFG